VCHAVVMGRRYRLLMATCCKCGLPYEPNRDKSSRCRSCKSVYNREHYLENKRIYVARASASKVKLRYANTKRLHDYLLEHPCVDCGERDPLVLEFDHIKDKDCDVSDLLGRAWTRVLNEIAKCEVRCANCHRRVTAKRAGWMRHRLNG
jgi:hypothetical protein